MMVVGRAGDLTTMRTVDDEEARTRRSRGIKELQGDASVYHHRGRMKRSRAQVDHSAYPNIVRYCTHVRFTENGLMQCVLQDPFPRIGAKKTISVCRLNLSPICLLVRN